MSVTATRQSAISLLAGSKAIQKKVNDTWQIAPKSKMFTRKLEPTKFYYRTNAKGEKVKYQAIRTNRLISGHAYKIAASGAALSAAAVMNKEGHAYRVPVGAESKRAPFLPAMTPGAVLMLEQFLCAYAQEATAHARDTRVALGTTTSKDGTTNITMKRLTGGLMKIGFDAAEERIFGMAAVVPRKTVVCKLPKKVPAAKAAEGEKKGEKA
jgi:hypothetical protein